MLGESACLCSRRWGQGSPMVSITSIPTAGPSGTVGFEGCTKQKLWGTSGMQVARLVLICIVNAIGISPSSGNALLNIIWKTSATFRSCRNREAAGSPWAVGAITSLQPSASDPNPHPARQPQHGAFRGFPEQWHTGTCDGVALLQCSQSS